MGNDWISISHRRLRNLGDQICRPGSYFDLPIAESIDWVNGVVPHKANCLIGGGGAIHPRLAKYGQDSSIGRIIVWGTGWVYRKYSLLARPQGIELYGSRDWGQDDADAWVPCASCMHSAFDEEYKIEREFGGFWNPDFAQPRVDVPFIHNTAGENEVFDWLGSSETVITNSFHGAYWATLLGRKVIIVGAYSGKFTHFEPSMQPPVVDAKDWKTAKPKIADGALELCRETNWNFAEQVKERMS